MCALIWEILHLLPFIWNSCALLLFCPGYHHSLPSSTAGPDRQRLPPSSTLSSEYLNQGGPTKVLLVICNTAGSGQQGVRWAAGRRLQGIMFLGVVRPSSSTHINECLVWRKLNRIWSSKVSKHIFRIGTLIMAISHKCLVGWNEEVMTLWTNIKLALGQVAASGSEKWNQR